MRRNMASASVGYHGAFLVHHDHRDTHRAAMLQICVPCVCSVWKRSAVWRQRAVYYCKCVLDNHQRNSFSSMGCSERSDTLLHDHWNPIRYAMLQDRETRPYALRCKDRLSGEGKRLSDYQPRISQSFIKSCRLLLHGA